MKQDITKIVMNPMRLRIVQYLAIHEQGTTGEILEELSDIPTASLYRHVKILLEAGCIEVVKEQKVRGTIQKTYRLTKQPLGEMTTDDVAGIFQSGLLSLLGSFTRYFAREDVDPQKDMLSLSTSTLMLTDQEYMDMLMKMGTVINEVIQNKPSEGRKPRRFTIVSSPCEEQDS